MNKALRFFPIVIGAMALMAMTASQQDNNPNGSSELSLLMRSMEKQLSDAKAAVLQGTYKGVYPSSFDKIYTAKPTDANTKTENFDVFAGVYINADKAFTANPSIDTYNNVVNTCLACHSQHCPGPVGRIKKLKIVQ